MAEAVTRRYRRLLKEDRRLPDLVIIDGGPGQLGAAVRAAAEVGLPMMKIISLAKRDEEIFTGRGQQPIRLAKSSPVLQLVQRIRDEAHRFAVTRHRARRKKRTLRSGLTDIPGVGPVTARKLLRAFGSLRAVKAAGREELSGVVGRKMAGRIREYYREGPA
jgi:excinuclease ABC subunit C